MIEVREAADVIGLKVLTDTSSKTFIARFVDRYVTEPRSNWWWHVAKGPAKIVEYGNDDGLQQMQVLVGGDVMANLIVTDEQAEPLGVVSGTVASLLAVVRECHAFEFVLADVDLAWAIFDTHHNSLVCVGSVADRST